jgi:deoxycytidine triphosphate deaminase
VLSNVEIRIAISVGDLTIEGFDESCLRASSYLLRLGRTILSERPGQEIIDTHCTDTAHYFENNEIGDRGVLIESNRLYLACSLERISLGATVVGQLSSLSSLARLGLSVSLASNLVSATFGKSSPSALTFEVMNVGRRAIRIYPMAQLCHISFFRHLVPADLEYAGIYGGETRPIAADFHRRPSR